MFPLWPSKKPFNRFPASAIICDATNSISGLADILFPLRCAVCGSFVDPKRKEEFFSLCPECLSRINFIESSICLSCGLPFDSTQSANHLCGDCISSKPYFSVARALGKYETVLSDIVCLFKYGGKIPAGEAMGRLMAAWEYDSLEIGNFSLIVPVPLNSRRLRKRGFNQSLVLARQISKKFSIPLNFTSLKRIVDTPPQIGMGKSQRASNVKNAFKVADKGNVKGKKILLVDDVYTTGSTVNECARTLLRNGAEEVAVLTLARA